MKKTIIVLSASVILILSACTPADNAAQPEQKAVQEQSSVDFTVTNPQPNTTVAFPLIVSGEAKGGWYFEGVFAIKLLDANGVQLAFATATAQGDWMTDSMVPFTSTIPSAAPTTATGKLVFEADNPSSLSSNAKSFEVPVSF